MTSIQFGDQSGGGKGPVQFRTGCGGEINLTGVPLSYALDTGHLRAEGSSLVYDVTLRSTSTPAGPSVHVTGKGRVPDNGNGVACIDTSAGPVDIPLTGALTRQCAPAFGANGMNYGALCDLSLQFNPKTVPQFKCAGTVVQDSVALSLKSA